MEALPDTDVPNREIIICYIRDTSSVSRVFCDGHVVEISRVTKKIAYSALFVCGEFVFG